MFLPGFGDIVNEFERIFLPGWLVMWIQEDGSCFFEHFLFTIECDLAPLSLFVKHLRAWINVFLWHTHLVCLVKRYQGVPWTRDTLRWPQCLIVPIYWQSSLLQCILIQLCHANKVLDSRLTVVLLRKQCVSWLVLQFNHFSLLKKSVGSNFPSLLSTTSLSHLLPPWRTSVIISKSVPLPLHSVRVNFVMNCEFSKKPQKSPFIPDFLRQWSLGKQSTLWPSLTPPF